MTYDTDLTDAQWSLLCGYFEHRNGGGRPFKHSPRNILSACFYVLKTGCQWRLLPKDFPPWQTVHGHFSRWKKNGTWHIILRDLHGVLRLLEGRNEQASAAIIDSQSVKAPTKKRGFDAGKKVKGIKRHLLVDVLGFPLHLVVHDAGIQDRGPHSIERYKEKAQKAEIVLG